MVILHLVIIKSDLVILVILSSLLLLLGDTKSSPRNVIPVLEPLVVEPQLAAEPVHVLLVGVTVLLEVLLEDLLLPFLGEHLLAVRLRDDLPAPRVVPQAVLHLY